MNKVAAVSGATDDELTALSDKAKELGATTQFSASQAADALGFLSMAGFSANEAMEALPGTLQLAAAAGMDLGGAADIVSNVLSGYALEVKDLSRVNDVLVKTFTSSNTNLEQMGQAMQYVGPIAAAGVQFEEASAAIGLLGNAGIQSTSAGTALRGAMAKMLVPTKEAEKAMKAAGLSFTDASGKLLPLADIIESLEPHAQDAALFMEIFGQKAGPGMAALVSQGSGALRNLTKELEGAGGSAQEVADKQMEGLNGAIKRMKSAFEALMIAIAESGLLDAITDLANKFAGLLTRLSETNPKLLKVATVAALVVAALGPVVTVVGTLTTVLAPLLALIGGAAGVGLVGSLGLLLGPLALIVVAVYAAVKAWQTFGPALKDNMKAREELYKAINGNRKFLTQERADTIEGAKAQIAEAVARRKNLQALLDQQKATLKKQVGGAVKLGGLKSTPLGGIAQLGQKRAFKNIEKTATAIKDAQAAVDENDAAIAAMNAHLVELGGVTDEAAEGTDTLTDAQKKAKAALDAMNASVTKASEKHTEAVAALKAEVAANDLLAEAMSKGQNEYDITAAKMALVKDGVEGTDAQLRAMAITLVASRDKLAASREAMDQAALASQGLTQKQKDAKAAEDDLAAAILRKKQAHQASVLSVQDEIAANAQLTAALKVSQNEYDITKAKLDILSNGFQGTDAEARNMAVGLVTSRDSLAAQQTAMDDAKAEAAKLADELAKTKTRAIDAFGAMAGAFDNLVAGFKSGNILDILGGILGMLDQIGNLSGGFSIGGLQFGGARAVGGPTVGGRSYLVGERGPEIFTPAQSGAVTPNHKLANGGTSGVEIRPSKYFDAVVDGRAKAVAKPIATDATLQGMSQYGQLQQDDQNRRLA